MYEGNSDLKKIYTMYHLDSHDSWKNYMESTVFEAINTDDVDLTSEYGPLGNEKAISIFMMDYTQKFQPDFQELKELSDEQKTEFLTKFSNSMLAESHMSYIDSYLVEEDALTFAVVELKVDKYHYTVAGTVTGGKVYTMMATSQNPEALLAEKKAIFDTVLQGFAVDTSAAVSDTNVQANESTTTDDQTQSDGKGQTDGKDQTGNGTAGNAGTQTGAKAGALSFPITANTVSSLFILLVFAVLFWGGKLKKGKEFHEDAFSLDKTKGLQGFCAIGIMLHHMAQMVTQNNSLDKGLLNVFCDIGVFFVGMFFFCSGFGLYTSFRSKPDYLKGFLRKRLSAILIPFYVGNIIFVVTTILFGAEYSTGQLVSALTGWVLMNTQLWYIVEIFVLYILFYILFRFIRKEAVAYWLMGISVVGLMVFSLLLGHDRMTLSGGAWFRGEWWYNGIFVFFIGMTFARYYQFLVKKIQKFYWIWLAVGICGSTLFYLLTEHMLKTKGYWFETETYPGYLEKIQTLSCQLPMIIFMVLTFLLITMKIQFKNRALTFLGQISLELYIIHNLFITNLRGTIQIKNDALFILSVYVLSISMAVLLHVFDHKLIQLVSGKKKGDSESGDGRPQSGGGQSGGGQSGKESPKSGGGQPQERKEHLIDCMRLIMMFLVICIHSPFEGKIGEILFGIGKVAVPFFLVVCGYFCYSGDREVFMKRIKKQAGRLFLLTAGAGFLYGYLYLLGAKLGYMDHGIQTLVTDKSMISLLVFNESPVVCHLWFLGSLFYALVLMLIVTRFRLDKYVMFAAPVLLGIYLWLSFTGKAEFYVYRNALLVTWPYFMMGCLIRRYKDQIQKHIRPLWINLAAVACLALLLVEYKIRNTLAVPFFSAEILVYLIVLVCLNYSETGKRSKLDWLGSKCTLFVYITHFIVIWVFWYDVFGLANVNPAIITVFAFFVPLLVSVGIELVKGWRKSNIY